MTQFNREDLVKRNMIKKKVAKSTKKNEVQNPRKERRLGGVDK
jgi:hypothetical protein